MVIWLVRKQEVTHFRIITMINVMVVKVQNWHLILHWVWSMRNNILDSINNGVEKGSR